MSHTRAVEMFFGRLPPRRRLRNPRHLLRRQRPRRLHQARHRLHRRPRSASRHLVHHPRRSLHSPTHAPLLPPPQSQTDAPRTLPGSLALTRSPTNHPRLHRPRLSRRRLSRKLRARRKSRMGGLLSFVSGHARHAATPSFERARLQPRPRDSTFGWRSASTLRKKPPPPGTFVIPNRVAGPVRNLLLISLPHRTGQREYFYDQP